MKQKSELKTIRFHPEETKKIEAYLEQNPVFESFSSLGRVATLSFIGQASTLHLQPVSEEANQKRPSFFWDYDLSEWEVREILRNPGLPPQKKWLMERILSQARFEEIMNYLEIEEIERWLPSLKLPQKIGVRWSYALKRWSRHG